MNRTTTHTSTSRTSRDDVLRGVIAELDDRRDGILPMHLAGVSEHFADDTSLLGALQLRWHATLSGLVERELASRPGDEVDAVVTAWARAAATQPGIRAAIDEALERPADEEMAGNVQRARVKEHAMLAAIAGLARPGNPAAEALGGRLEEQARRLSVPAVERAIPLQSTRTGRGRDGLNGFVGRVRHLVA